MIEDGGLSLNLLADLSGKCVMRVMTFPLVASGPSVPTRIGIATVLLLLYQTKEQIRFIYIYT